jgi:hypothetical protein
VESRWWNHNIINVIKEPLSVKSSDNSSSGEVDVVKVVESPMKQKNHNVTVPKVIRCPKQMILGVGVSFIMYLHI